MLGRVRLTLASIAALLIFSSSAFAQASITSVVRRWVRWTPSVDVQSTLRPTVCDEELPRGAAVEPRSLLQLDF